MSFTDFVKSAAGLTEKAVIIIGDVSEVEVKEVDAQKPSAGVAAGVPGGSNGYNLSVVTGMLQTAEQRKKDVKFEAVGDIKKYRFEVQFNPSEISISGYGGENMPTQTFGQIPPNPGQGNPPNGGKPPGPPRFGSRMASASTRITMSFRVVFDKTPATNMISNNMAVKAGKALLGKTGDSVQDEVEALHAVARDDNKRLAMFIWGDMIYEGVINSVDSDYVMFNKAGQPIRAYVNIGMVLYAEHDLGKNVDTWRKEYQRDFYDLKESAPFTRFKF